jgi:hypothetical protein
MASQEIGESLNSGDMISQIIGESSSSESDMISQVNDESLSSQRDVTNQQTNETPSHNENYLPSAVVDTEIWNFGRPTFKCWHCNALLWYEERLGPNKRIHLLEYVVKMERLIYQCWCNLLFSFNNFWMGKIRDQKVSEKT